MGKKRRKQKVSPEDIKHGHQDTISVHDNILLKGSNIFGPDVTEQNDLTSPFKQMLHLFLPRQQ